MSKTSLGHDPKGRWQFDEAVAECFPDMLERSVPQIRFMRLMVDDLADRFTRGCGGSWVVDLGASLGGASSRLIEKSPELNYHLIDNSKAMTERLRDAYEISPAHVVIEHCDLRVPERILPAGRGPYASLVLAVLTLQFLPFEDRRRLLKEAYGALDSGGAVILVEKVLGSTAAIDEIMTEQYAETKQRNGYTRLEIERKREALQGVLVPMTADMNERMLFDAGFEEIDCFWRVGCFAGWLGIKR